jgi:hypothetical protein
MKLPYIIPILATVFFCAVPLRAADLPDGPGKALILRECNACHDAADHVSGLKRTRDEWIDTISKMMEQGAGFNGQEFDTVIAYLVKNFGKEEPRIGAARTPVHSGH